jgi:hypothetical protein
MAYNYVCDSCNQRYLYDPGGCPGSSCNRRPVRYTGDADRAEERERERERERARQAQRERDAAQRAQAEKAKSSSKTNGSSGSGCGCLVLIILGLIVIGALNSKDESSKSTSTETTANIPPTGKRESKPMLTPVPQTGSSVQPSPRSSYNPFLGGWPSPTPTPRTTPAPIAPTWPSPSPTEEPIWKKEVQARLAKGIASWKGDQSVTPIYLPYYDQIASDSQLKFTYQLRAGEYYLLVIVGDDSNTGIEPTLFDPSGNQVLQSRNGRGGGAVVGKILETGTYTLAVTIRCSRGMCGYGTQVFRLTE